MSTAREPFCPQGRSSGPMSTNIRRVRYRLRRFERWFDRYFGWYFTNGMKHGPRVAPEKKPSTASHLEQTAEEVR